MDEVPRPYKEVAEAATGIAQALESLEVLSIGLERAHIESLDMEPGAVSPAWEAVCTPQEVMDTASLIATSLKPAQEGIEVRTGGFSPVVL
jgi:hypothetical protein